MRIGRRRGGRESMNLAAQADIIDMAHDASRERASGGAARD
jgi:hypothetical protein